MMYLLLIGGSLVALVAGGWLYLYGDTLRARAERAGRPRPANAMSPAAERRFGLVMALLGLAGLLLAFFI